MTEQQASATLSLPQLISQVIDRLLNDLHRHLVEAGYEDLRPTHCLNVFRFMDCEGTRPTAMARRAGMTPQAMSDLVGYLEQHGYVRRVSDPVDRRGRVVVYADRGTTAAMVADSFFANVESRWGDIVGPDRFQDMKFVLAEILGSSSIGNSDTGKGLRA